MAIFFYKNLQMSSQMAIFASQSEKTEINMKYSEIVRKLKKSGCYIERAGSRHDIWYSPITNNYFQVPRHQSQEAKKGTVKDISEKSGVKF